MPTLKVLDADGVARYLKVNGSGTTGSPYASSIVVDSVTGNITVIANDLDIRNLDYSTDNVTAVQGGAWTVVANAGTNLNTSLLALESGGNLAACASQLGSISGNTATIVTCITGGKFQTDVLTLPNVTLTAGELHLGALGGHLSSTAVELTRPADTTAYTAGDVVSNSTVSTTLLTLANAARVSAGSGYIVGCRLVTDKKSITPRFRVHLFNANNPTVAADNAAMRSHYTDASKRLGYFDLAAMTTATDTGNSDESRTLDMTLRIPFVCAGGTTSLFALLETLDAFTPNSGQKFTLTLVLDQN